MGITLGRVEWLVACGAAAVLFAGGCASGGTPVQPTDPPTASATAAASARPSQSPSQAPAAASASASAAAPATTAKPTVAAPATTAPATPPPAYTQAPQLPTEQAKAAEGFAVCAQRYQERIQNVTLGPEVTPVLLEAWAQAYEEASALAAEGDPAAAATACTDLQSAMDAVLG